MNNNILSLCEDDTECTCNLAYVFGIVKLLKIQFCFLQLLLIVWARSNLNFYISIHSIKMELFLILFHIHSFNLQPTFYISSIIIWQIFFSILLYICIVKLNKKVLFKYCLLLCRQEAIPFIVLNWTTDRWYVYNVILYFHRETVELFLWSRIVQNTVQDYDFFFNIALFTMTD